MKLLDYHVADRGLTGGRTSRNTYSAQIHQKQQQLRPNQEAENEIDETRSELKPNLRLRKQKGNELCEVTDDEGLPWGVGVGESGRGGGGGAVGGGEGGRRRRRRREEAVEAEAGEVGPRRRLHHVVNCFRLFRHGLFFFFLPFL